MQLTASFTQLLQPLFFVFTAPSFITFGQILIAHNLIEAGESHLNLDRVVIRNPGATYTTSSRTSKGTLAISAKHCLFENGAGEHFGCPR